MILDDEDEFNSLCGSCQSKSKTPKCPGCGDNKITERNENFDDAKFEELKKKYGG